MLMPISNGDGIAMPSHATSYVAAVGHCITRSSFMGTILGMLACSILQNESKKHC